MARVESAKRNIAFGYLGQLATALISFAMRTVFIVRLSADLLGVNGTYTNILSLLSMTELGIGTALNFALYAPVARGDREKIKAYMQMYRRAYSCIAAAVAIIGTALAPFLKYLIKNPGNISLQDLTLYYFIFLFNTVSTYFVSYKYSLANAEQKNYIQTNINTVTKLLAVGLQILVVLWTGNFLLYLLTDAFVQLGQKIFVSWYLNRRYPCLKEKNIQPLSPEEKGVIWKKTGALMLHRVGDAARLQTDALVISSMIQVAVVGMVDNYNLVVSTVSNFVNIIFNSTISGFGNLVATEDREKQYAAFRVYRFFAVWVYGFSATGFLIMLTPLIRLWLGDLWVLPPFAVFLYILDYFFKGDRIVSSNFKTAAGVFEQDKYLALIQGAVNLAVSVIMVRKIGLAGVYVGTVVSGLIANITKPFIIYRVCFQRNAMSYFADSVKYIGVVFAVAAVCSMMARRVLAQLSVASFIEMGLLITAVFNGVFLLVFGRSEEFQYLFKLLKGKRG